MTEPSTTQRDDLARDIFIADNSAHPNAGAEWDAFTDIGGACGGDYAYDIADGLLAAGYRKPRTITTAAELDALPAGAVILGRDRVACQKEEIPGLWDSAGELISTDFVALPATVLHESEAEATA